MKILDGLVLRPLGGEFIVTGDGISRVDFSKVVSMNATAAYLWNSLQGKDFGLEELVKRQTDRYDVKEAQARTDAQALIASWLDAGMICE